MSHFPGKYQSFHSRFTIIWHIISVISQSFHYRFTVIYLIFVCFFISCNFWTASLALSFFCAASLLCKTKPPDDWRYELKCQNLKSKSSTGISFVLFVIVRKILKIKILRSFVVCFVFTFCRLRLTEEVSSSLSLTQSATYQLAQASDLWNWAWSNW